MNVSQLSFRDLEYLVAISEHLSFAKASSQLHVSQPTLSEQIKKLENHLKYKIFERTSRKVQMTPEGEKIITLARKLLLEGEEFLQMAQLKTEPLTQVFHLGAIATVGPYYFPYILSTLRKKFPKLELIIHEGMTDQLLEMLDQGKLDAVVASHTFKDQRFRVYPLFFEPFYLAAPKNKNFKVKNGKVSLKEIDPNELILLTEGNCLKDETLNLCKLSKASSQNKTQASSLETLKHLVALGNGYTLIPKLAIDDNKKLSSLMTYYPLQEIKAGREIVLVSREQYSKPEEIRLLYQTLKNIELK